jgi:hypothetical protein
MATVEHPIGLNSEQHRAFSEKVFWQTVGIVNLVRVQGKTDTGRAFAVEEMGAGSACLWKDRKLILTAKHVLEGAGPTDLLFFLRPSEQIDWVTRAATPTLARRIALQIETIVECPQEDLAVLILADEDADRSRLHFCDLPTAFAPVPSGPGVTLLIGYPGDQSFPVASTRQPNGSVHYDLAAVPAVLWGSIVDEIPRFFPSSYDPNRHFLIRFDPREEGSMPHGYSGTGVWYQRSGKREVWVADPVLAGVQKEWHRESNLMIGIRSEFVRDFLERSLG